MKNLNKISILLILLLGLTFTSCETTDLDLINDPNQITVENGDLERYMVAIQVDFANFVSAMGSNGARLVRIEQMSAGNYATAFEPIFTKLDSSSEMVAAPKYPDAITRPDDKDNSSLN